MEKKTKKCTKCHEEKRLDQFGFNKSKGRFIFHCRICSNESARKYNKKKREIDGEQIRKQERIKYAKIKAEEGKPVREYRNEIIDKENFIRVCNESSSMAVACSTLGLSFTRFKEHAIKLGCYKPNQGNKTNPKGKKEKDITEYKSRSGIKVRIIKDKLIPIICDECKLEGIWNNKPIVLHLDHINGLANDHRLENLRFLCPNCHSQTNSYTGRNINKPCRDGEIRKTRRT